MCHVYIQYINDIDIHTKKHVKKCTCAYTSSYLHPIPGLLSALSSATAWSCPSYGPLREWNVILPVMGMFYKIGDGLMVDL